jgi:7,8-dihydropterin-6-yl-methyl-4-(beta-D-ribofuranosyl)aminobenzene 5'-phosphate synthase
MASGRWTRLVIPALVTIVLAGSVRAGPASEGASLEGDTILNLYDAFGPEVPGTVQDFGFSALVRYRDKTILFDAGTNAEILAKNVEALGVDLRDVDFAVASHSHFDHISGFDHVLEVNPDLVIYFPYDPFWGAPFPFDATGTDPGAAADLPVDQRYFRGEKTEFTFQSSGRFWRANVQFVKSHT